MKLSLAGVVPRIVPMRSFIISVLSVLFCPVFATADEKPLLTEKEITEGWILLFDGGTTFGWKIEGEGSVKDGVLKLGGSKQTVAAPTTQLFAGDFKMECEGLAHVHLKTKNEESSFGLTPQPTNFQLKLRFSKEGSDSGTETNVGPDKIVHIKADAGTNGPATLSFEVPAGGTLAIKSLKAKPFGAKPLFNGKNLDGWKVFQGDPKRAATKFDVTPARELSAKNGPGDLQTEKQFDDFILQLECKTNGKALNSGIFFRCIPDQYQNGYEAQIQNAYLGDRTKPLDYGTGAIYRRVAARKVVSNDNEWFTMTVVAQGAHFSTWVNGYQTVDWTDDRKANDNPRQGLRTEKGHLSIQGHDPTTDLLFRNIRIAELPRKD